MKKFFTLMPWEWLDKTGDSKKLLVRFSIKDEVERSASDHKDVIQAVIVKVSESAQATWQNNNSQFRKHDNLQKELLFFAVSTIRDRVRAGEKLSPNEELNLDTYSDFVPPDPDTIQISSGYVEIIEVEKKLGFLK